MRICYFLDSFESGGIEAFISGVILHLPEHIEADIVAKRIGDSVFTERLKAFGVRFFELSGKSHSPKNARNFKRLLRERRYDAVHLNIFHALDLRYAKIAKTYGVEVRIAHAHSAGLRRSASLPIKMLVHKFSRRIFLRFATTTLACSQKAAEFVFGGEADGYIKNGIDTARFAYSEEKRKRIRGELSLDGKIVIGHVGRLSSEKNQVFLLSVLREILSIGADAVLLLIGEGEDKEMLRALSEELGIQKSVIFYGATTKVGELYSAMDIFLFPSLFEGFGIAALEAQCAGLPVICSDGVPSDAKICEGCITLPLDIGALKWADTAIDMLNARNERKSGCGEIIAAGYDISKTALEVAKYYGKS